MKDDFLDTNGVSGYELKDLLYLIVDNSIV